MRLCMRLIDLYESSYMEKRLRVNGVDICLNWLPRRSIVRIRNQNVCRLDNNAGLNNSKWKSKGPR